MATLVTRQAVSQSASRIIGGERAEVLHRLGIAIRRHGDVVRGRAAVDPATSGLRRARTVGETRGRRWRGDDWLHQMLLHTERNIREQGAGRGSLPNGITRVRPRVSPMMRPPNPGPRSATGTLDSTSGGSVSVPGCPIIVGSIRSCTPSF